jgi:hypothetical protein
MMCESGAAPHEAVDHRFKSAASKSRDCHLPQFAIIQSSYYLSSRLAPLESIIYRWTAARSCGWWIREYEHGKNRVTDDSDGILSRMASQKQLLEFTDQTVRAFFVSPAASEPIKRLQTLG